jgi:hypothetical protein
MIRGAQLRRRPPETALAFADRHIIDAGFAAAHQAVLVEFPLLIAVGAEPLSGVVMPFVLETHGDEIAVERPEILDQPVACACRKSNPDVLVVQSTQDRTAKNVSSTLNGARCRRILVQR